MCLYPEVQRKAQAELDENLSITHSLPTFADRPNLPYVTAIVEETLRWQIVAPLGPCFLEHPHVPQFMTDILCAGVPHVVTEDDEYNGYFIPKGTLVLGNSW